MRPLLGTGFGVLVLVAAAWGAIRWTLDGATDWVVKERERRGTDVGADNGHRDVDEMRVVDES